MKLPVALALVGLALCCSSASSEICPEFLQIVEVLLTGTQSNYEAALQPFNLGPELTDAGIQMKTVLDTLPQVVRENVLKLTEKILTSPPCKEV